MTKAQEAKLKRLGVFTLAQAETIGLKPPRITRLVQAGKLKRVGHGIYLHPEASISSTVGFQIAQVKFGPLSAIGGLSALFHYNLIEQVPGQTWVIVSPKTRSYERIYRLIRTISDPQIGIDSQDGYRIASVERALIEALKFSSKIGEGTALKAVRTAIAKKLTTEAKLGRMAKTLHLEKTLAKFFEAIIS